MARGGAFADSPGAPPTKVGITGHRFLERHGAWVTVEMRRVIDEIPRPLIGITSLAIGADQVFARAVRERNGSLWVVVPFRAYRQVFTPEDAAGYDRLLAEARKVEVLHEGGNRDESYAAAGRRVVDLSDRVVAVWDGRPAGGRGGTAEIVEYARQKRKPLTILNPVTETVIRENAPP